VPSVILLKPGPLSALEYEAVKSHPLEGAQLLGGTTLPVLELAREVALSHHERWDGSGYPSGLRGADIPRSARIVYVADVYDALVSERVYKPAWTSVDAAQYILAGSGAQFDPEVVDAFVRVVVRREPSLSALLGRSTPA